MGYYLIANFCSAFSNILAKFFVSNDVIQIPNVRIIDIMLHSNIISLFLLSMFYIFKKSRNEINFTFKETFIGRKEVLQIVLFAIPIVAANYKIYLMGFMSISGIEISAMIKPFCVWCLAVVLLHEGFEKSYLKYFVGISVGFMIANYDKIHVSHFWYLVSYIAIASCGDITRRYFCRVKKDSFQAVCVECVLFCLYGTVILLFIRKSFSLKLLLSPYVFTISCITFSHHFCMIYGVRKAATIVSLEFLNFSKLIFTIILSCFILKDLPTTHKMCGALIIAVTLILFNKERRRIDALHGKKM